MAEPKPEKNDDAPNDTDASNAQRPTNVSAAEDPNRQVDHHNTEGVDSQTVDSSPSDSLVQAARSSPARYFSFFFLLAVIGLVGVIFYWVMAKFLIPLFLAALLVVIFRPLHAWILQRTRGQQKLSAALTTLAIALTVLAPMAILMVMAAAESRDVFNHFNAAKILEDIQIARKKMNLDLPNADQVREIDERLDELQLPDNDRFDQLKSQGTDLFEISEAAKVIADTQNLESVDAENETSSPQSDLEADEESPRDEKWEAFSSRLNQVRELQRNLSGKMDPTSDEFNSGLHDYRIELQETQQAFALFKYDLLGGKTRAFAIELLNPTEEKLRYYAEEGRQFLQKRVVEFGGVAGSILGSLVIGTAIMIISLYFFLLDGPAMMLSFQGLSPLDDEHEQELVGEFGRVSRAVVVATLLSALAQGLLAGIGFYVVGLESIFLLTLLSAVLAMVPFVGAAAVWIPCALYLYFFDNNLPAAIGLAIYGVAVISMADNFIKPFILHGETNLHPLLALLSVIGGVAALGPIGILIGPMVVVFLQTLLKILQRELLLMEGQGKPQTS